MYLQLIRVQFIIIEVQMQANSRLERQEQVKVVIRLKPEASELKGRCVYLAEQENQLVVQTDLKKQIFVFDHVAHQSSSQADIYQMIGAEAVQVSLEGYNCCIFAYGQTGAGKSFSIMGDVIELTNDYYSPTRGLLPRLLQDLFSNNTDELATTHCITCSYIQIYNEQIFDLFTTQKKTHQIRQDHRKGVFVEGVVETKLTSYRQAMDILLEGQKMRTIAYTSMNAQSSRSHVIFTIMIGTSIKQDGITKIKKSKLNIVDLAGSERVKYTNVEGERLREGCNINKSLHVLGNVINSLVESAKKKKHIPYRDSKLTYYLKDSLGGNSITKFLANVHCGKEYIGDTLSTLMFAKRAKILKMRVQVNQNFTQNFDTLRKQVRRLREELAEARYFRDNQKTERTSFYQDLQPTLQRISDNSDYSVVPKIQIIQVFEENELHYKSLMEIYEQHLKDCAHQSSVNRRNSINKVGQWKNLQKRNIALSNLVRQFPAFTKIFKQNLLLKQDRSKNQEDSTSVLPIEDRKDSKIQEQSSSIPTNEPNHVQISPETIDNIIKIYQQIIDDINQKFVCQLDNLQRSYSELQHQSKIKDKKIKQLIKQQDLPPDIQQLKNENEYLHLNILNLQNEIKQLQQSEDKMNIQKRKDSVRRSHRKSIIQKQGEEEEQDTIGYLMQKVVEIKKEAEKQMESAQKEREHMENIISQLSAQVSSLMNENNKLQLKYKRSGSHKKSREKFQNSPFLETSVKKSMIDFPKEAQFFRTNTSEHPFNHSQSNFTKEMMTLRLQIKMKHKEIVDLKEQVLVFEEGDQKIQSQFGKSLNDIVKEYREIMKKQAVATSLKAINKYKQQDPQRNSFGVQQKTAGKKSSIDSKAINRVQTPRYSKKEDPSATSSFNNSKNNFFSPK